MDKKKELELLSRDKFRLTVFARDKHACVNCGIKNVPLNAHHIIERRLFTAEEEKGGYFIENGVTVCDDGDHAQNGMGAGCHRLAEQTRLTPEHLREKAGITKIILPDGTYDGTYTKWLDPIMPDGRRGRGPLFNDPSVQKILEEGGVAHLYTQYAKYPRTWHLPTSPGHTKDDRGHAQVPFGNKEIVVTLKMDGENTTINSDGFVHARSLEGATHTSQAWVRNFSAKVAYQLEPGFRICGENLYAKHSIQYKDLPSYFMLFSVWNEKNESLSWDDVELWAQALETPTVPVLYRGIWDEAKIEKAYKSYQVEHGEQEGWVARNADSFPYANFRENVGKWVRKGHVQETVHNWRMGWYENEETINALKIKERTVVDLVKIPPRV